jgi:hypothetical protein
MMAQEQLENVEYFKYLGSLTTNNTRFTHKDSIHQEESFFHKRTGLKFKGQINKTLHTEHSFVSC